MSRAADLPPTLRLLFISGTQEDMEAMQGAFKQQGISVRVMAPTNAADAMAAISPDIDIIIIDPKYPLVSFNEVVRAAREVEWGSFEPNLKNSPMGIPLIAQVEMAGDEQWLSQGACGLAVRGQTPATIRLINFQWALVRARRQAGFATGALKDAETRCNALIDSSRDAIAYLHEGLHVRMNSPYLEIFGAKSEDDLEGLSLLDMVAPEQQAQIKDLLKKMARGGKAPDNLNILAQSLDGSTWGANLFFEQATYDGERCLQMIVRKQKEKDEGVSEEKIKELLARDQVTGMLARGVFLEHLEKSIESARDGATEFSFILVEPDQYARILGQVGLTYGDTLVAAIATRVNEVLTKNLGPTAPTSWVAGRLGDHQLSILLKVSTSTEGKAIGDLIQKSFVNSLLEADGHSVSMTVSQGGVHLETKVGDLGTVLGKAQGLLHEVQQAGGNNIRILDPGAGDREAMMVRQQLIDRIRGAIDNDGFIVRYQPLVALHGEPREFYELHIDLPRMEGETTAPMWLEAAGDGGLLWEVDRWRVGKAISDIDQRARLGHQTHLMVPISVASIQDDSLVQHVAMETANYPALASSGAERLTLMLTENQISTHLKHAQTFRLKMSNIGAKVGLDHFGGGFEGNGVDPLQMLAHFGADRLRMANGLVAGLMDPKKSAAVKDIIAQVKLQKKEMLASGVETAGAMSALFNSGVAYAQGSFLAHISSKMDHEF